jgi:hypothetical protein
MRFRSGDDVCRLGPFFFIINKGNLVMYQAFKTKFSYIIQPCLYPNLNT